MPAHLLVPPLAVGPTRKSPFSVVVSNLWNTFDSEGTKPIYYFNDKLRPPLFFKAFNGWFVVAAFIGLFWFYQFLQRMSWASDQGSLKSQTPLLEVYEPVRSRAGKLKQSGLCSLSPTRAMQEAFRVERGITGRWEGSPPISLFLQQSYIRRRTLVQHCVSHHQLSLRSPQEKKAYISAPRLPHDWYWKPYCC